MNVVTIKMPVAEAKEAYREYRQAVQENPNSRDTAIMLGYKALAQGKAIINVSDAIRTAGLDEQFRPKLAIARADWLQVQFESVWRSGSFLAYSRKRPDRNRHGSLFFNRSIFSGEVRTGILATVPMIPPKLRPAGKLSRYHILWEAEWTEPPRDPLLLRHLASDLYAVLAVWDLTEVERSVLGSRLNLG